MIICCVVMRKTVMVLIKESQKLATFVKQMEAT